MLTFETASFYECGILPPIINKTTPTTTNRAKIAIAKIIAFFLFISILSLLLCDNFFNYYDFVLLRAVVVVGLKFKQKQNEILGKPFFIKEII
jgi:hypothetical protein